MVGIGASLNRIDSRFAQVLGASRYAAAGRCVRGCWFNTRFGMSDLPCSGSHMLSGDDWFHISPPTTQGGCQSRTATRKTGRFYEVSLISVVYQQRRKQPRRPAMACVVMNLRFRRQSRTNPYRVAHRFARRFRETESRRVTILTPGQPAVISCHLWEVQMENWLKAALRPNCSEAVVKGRIESSRVRQAARQLG